MFIRKKKNKSGVISVQVIDKSSGNYKLIKTIGSSTNLIEIERLYGQGVSWVRNYTGAIVLDFKNEQQLNYKAKGTNIF